MEYARIGLVRTRIFDLYISYTTLFLMNWAGTKFFTRQGHQIAAPAWFTADLPAQPLDGELW